MQNFIRQILQRETQTLTLAGSTLSWDLQRSSIIKCIWLELECVIGTVAATPTVEGIFNLIKSVTLQGTLDGQNYTPINNLTGKDLYDMYQAQTGNLPLVIGSGLGSTGYNRIRVPLCFDQKRWGALRYVTALRARDCSDLNLQITPANQADVDVNGTPTLVLTSCNITVFQDQFDVYSIPAKYPTLKMLNSFKEYTNIASQSQAEHQLPAGGLYSFIVLKSYASVNAKQSPATTPASAAPILTIQGSSINLYDLNQQVKQKITFPTLIEDNIDDVVDTLVTGNAMFLFNRGTNDLFYTGAIEKAESYVNIRLDLVAATGSKVRYVYQRIFDPNDMLSLKIGA